MLKIIVAFILLFLSILVGLQLTEEPGYFFVSYKDWTIETPLWFSVLALIFTFTVFHLFWRIFKFFVTLPSRIIFWRRSRKIAASWRNTKKGLVALNEGRWKTAEKVLLKATDNEDISLLTYLAAAQSAQAQGKEVSRDKYLQLAQKSNKKANLSVVLTQAKMYIDSEKYKEALSILSRIYKKNPKHPYVLSLLRRIYEKERDWDKLLQLIPKLYKHNVIKTKEKRELEKTVYLALLNKLQNNRLDKDELKETFEKLWHNIPYYLKFKAPFIIFNIKFLLVQQRHAEAEKVVHRVLRLRWDDVLVELYSRIKSNNPVNQLKIAEKWLKKHSESASLYLALARLSQRNKLWGKARSYYKESVRIAPSPTVYREYGDLLNQLGELETAAKCYKAGLMQAQKIVRKQ